MICIFRRKSIQDPAIARLTVVTSLALLKSDVALSMSALVITIHNNSYRPQLGINQPFTENLYLSPLGRYLLLASFKNLILNTGHSEL